MIEPEIMVLKDDAAIAADAAERIIAASDESIALSGKFSIALSGGSTPKRLFELLATDAYRSRINWGQFEVFFGDERCVPPDSSESNFRMANEALLSKVPIPAAQVHRMKGEIDPNEAAKEYGELLKARFGDGGIDVVLLGMGPDGHTASLFPHTAALKETKHRCVANYVEKLKTWRITLTAPFINRSRQVMVLAAGESKKDRLVEVLEGPRDPERLPIQMISPTDGKMTWLVDVLAAGM